MKTIKKECSIIRLPSNIEEFAPNGNKFIDYISLSTSRMESLNNKLEVLRGINGTKLINLQHLYIVDDSKIKEGDYYHYVGHILKYEEDEHTLTKNCKKIIATTDENLMHLSNNGRVGYNLPRIPQSFIKQYCEEGGIDEVMIDYNVENIKQDGYAPNIEGAYIDVLTLKLNSNNEVSISSIKESWSREEVIMVQNHLLNNALKDRLLKQDANSIAQYIIDWNKENL